MPNLVYQNEDTVITWRDTGGSALLTLTSLAAGAGRQGALYDAGVAARAYRYYFRAWVKFATTPVVNEKIRLYIKTSDGTNPDNDDGAGDIAVSAEDKLLNLTPIKSIFVDEASTTPVFVTSGVIEIQSRYFAPVFWNATVDALSATASDHGFDLTPIPDEIQ